MRHTPCTRPAPYTTADGAEANATLTDVCFKPFGGACATQSVLQYWRMDRGYYEAEMAKGPYSAGRLTPDYCFGHWWAPERRRAVGSSCLAPCMLCTRGRCWWTGEAAAAAGAHWHMPPPPPRFTQCRSAFEAPMDPHVVLGGFPTGEAFRREPFSAARCAAPCRTCARCFPLCQDHRQGAADASMRTAHPGCHSRNYSADATSFVITYPIDPSPSNRAAALAWEAAFIEVARGRLAELAEGANLTIAFSAERCAARVGAATALLAPTMQ